MVADAVKDKFLKSRTDTCVEVEVEVIPTKSIDERAAKYLANANGSDLDFDAPPRD